jgi:glycosyltransferase involved in cell wall biosynthesis
MNAQVARMGEELAESVAMKATKQDRAPVGEAVVFSGFRWGAKNTPERVALALGQAGWRVLYCSNASSFLREGSGRRSKLAENVQGLEPWIFGQRLNALPIVDRWQAKLLVAQVLRHARELGLQRPVVVYPHGIWFAAVAREFRYRNLPCLFLCMDHTEEEEREALANEADLILAIPPTMYRLLKEEFGDKVRLIPQISADFGQGNISDREPGLEARWESVPRPRLAYLGAPNDRLDVDLIAQVLEEHPEWNILTCGQTPNLARPNLHNVGWVGSREISAISRAIDAGFMPYDCRIEFNLHCVPLKLFDYFEAGLPVVSTPILCLQEYKDLVYLGETAEELAQGIRNALAEAPDDPRRAERRRIAREHSPKQVANLLEAILTEVFGKSHAVGEGGSAAAGNRNAAEKSFTDRRTK